MAALAPWRVETAWREGKHWQGRSQTPRAVGQGRTFFSLPADYTYGQTEGLVWKLTYSMKHKLSTNANLLTTDEALQDLCVYNILPYDSFEKLFFFLLFDCSEPQI